MGYLRLDNLLIINKKIADFYFSVKIRFKDIS